MDHAKIISFERESYIIQFSGDCGEIYLFFFTILLVFLDKSAKVAVFSKSSDYFIKFSWHTVGCA